MNNYIISVLTAVFLYAAANVALEKYLSQYSSLGILMYMYPMMLMGGIASVGVYKYTGTEVNSPIGFTAIAIALAVGVIYYFADWSYVNAYSKGGSVATITSIMASFPIVAQLMKAGLDGQVPSLRNILGSTVVAAGILIFFSGDKDSLIRF
jgi:drug/metabolite transporter (DMT)-like permease